MAQRTQKQREAQKRNHLIMRLRGTCSVFEAVMHTSGDLASIGTASECINAVDVILTRMGAETEADRRQRYQRELHDAITNRT